mgnify:FL=1
MKRKLGMGCVVLPAYNAAATVATSVQSLLSRSYIDWELIVVNDGSTDATSDVVASYLSDGRVVLIEQENGGVSRARNAGIRVSRGEFVAFLDADDLWETSKLAEQVACFHVAPESLGIVHTRYVSFIKDPSCFRRKDDESCFGYLPPAERILVYDFIATSAVMVRASILEEVGLFDENLFGTEDWDLWIRILSRYDQHKLDKVLLRYRESATGLSADTLKHQTEEWKVIEKQLLSRASIPAHLKAKAIFYHKMKELIYLVNHMAFGRFLVKVFCSMMTYPRAYFDPSNYLDAVHIFLYRNILKRW